MRHSPWREDGSVVYNCCWSSPAQSRGTHGHILLSQIRDSPNLEGQVPYLYPHPRIRWPSFTPRHWVPFSLPPTRRVTVEVFEPVSTQIHQLTLNDWISSQQYMKVQFVPDWKHITTYYESHTKHTANLCRQFAEIQYVKASATYSNHWVLKG
jgi:hypothetical protein